MAKRITFKSTPDNWKKEYLGLKPNTLRKIDASDDIRWGVLNDFIFGAWNIIDIEIENTETTEVFVRRVTDVTRFDDFFIISWEHNLNERGTGK